MRTRAQDYGDDVRRLLEMGIATTATSYVRAQRARSRMLAEALSALEGRSVLVAPASAITAPRIGEGRMVQADGPTLNLAAAILRFTSPFNATGQPALAIPTGLTGNGLPASMQIIGRPFDEAGVIRVAGAYEAARGPLAPPKP